MSENATDGNPARTLLVNAAGAVAGALLAGLTMFLVVASESSATQPQTNTEVISYNS